MAQLTSRSAVVTGASQGIGKSIATAFAREGINTILAARSIEKLEAGAHLVQIYTGFIYEGPGLIKRINKKILKNNN